MKAGARAVGIAESYRGTTTGAAGATAGGSVGSASTVAAAVLRADRVVDGLEFGTWTVGGDDATATAIGLVEALGREDLQYVLLSGIAPAWFNVLDLRAIHEAVDRPVVSVSYEASSGLAPALRRAFSGDELAVRLSTYERQPPRERLVVNGESVFVRALGVDVAEARDVVRAFTPEGGRPEPLRVARLAARAADRFRTD